MYGLIAAAYKGKVMANIDDPISHFVKLPDLRTRPEVSEACVMDKSFLATAEGLPPDPRCVICSSDMTKGSQIVYVGLIGRYFNYQAFVYLCHTDCVHSNMDMVRAVEDKRDYKIADSASPPREEPKKRRRRSPRPKGKG